MEIITKFFAKEFSDETKKQAYLKACIWVAENIINGDEISDVYWHVVRIKNTDLPSFRLELFVMLDEKNFRHSTCERCKEFHSLFYMNQQFNCDACNMTAYLKQSESKLAIKKQFAKERLRKKMNE